MIKAKLRVLLIDDNELDTIIVQEHLAQSMSRDYKLEIAHTAKAGMRLAESRDYDVILVDQFLDHGLGLDLIAQRVIKGDDRPFILLTGLNSIELEEQAVKSGVADFIPKQELSCSFLDRSIRYAIERKEHDRLLENSRRQAIEAERAKSTFLATMSHEFRTPMNGVMGMLNLLQLGKLNPDQTLQVDAANQSAQQLMVLIDNVLDYSRLEAGELAILHDAFDLQHLVRDTLLPLQASCEEKRLDWTLDLEQLSFVKVKGDASRFSDVLTCLVGNAIKYTQDGSVKVTVNTRANEVGCVECKVIVEDTGIGIPEHFSGQIFEAFKQAEQSASRSYEGAGLALAKSKKLCQLMRGDLFVESIEGKGSIFTAIVNFEHEERVIAASDSAAQDQEYWVLLVEDNKISQLVTIAILEKFGLKVDVAENGQNAIDVLTHESGHKYDLILMDCQMPVMDGYEATRLIRQGRAGNEYLETPIVAVTGDTAEGDRERCLSVGMDDYVAKPLIAEGLESKLHRWLH